MGLPPSGAKKRRCVNDQNAPIAEQEKIALEAIEESGYELTATEEAE